jgi:hypothetical protein
MGPIKKLKKKLKASNKKTLSETKPTEKAPFVFGEFKKISVPRNEVWAFEVEMQTDLDYPKTVPWIQFT